MLPLRARDEGDGERPNSLRTVDQHALDVAGCRWTSMKRGVVRLMELGSSVSILQPRHDVVGIEQYHKMLRQVGQRVYHQLIFGKEHGPGLCDTEQRPDNCHVHVREIPRL